MKNKKQKRAISVSEYNKKMSKIIKKYSKHQIDECLIALLDEAAKWEIKDE